jgi:hypothetical protein
MNETRTNPRTGWVRADQARGKEDLDREQALVEEISAKEKLIRRLERKIRDRMVPLSGIDTSDLAQGADTYPLMVTFQDSHKRLISKAVDLTWDEIFSVIAPTMYGYIMRRGQPAYNRLVGQYSFEGALIEFVRSKIIQDCGARQINIQPHQIDDVLIQFKQLGLMGMTETDEDDGKSFRGYSLTVAGEEHLTRLKVRLRS